jgi:hypothetical protein
MYFEEHGDTRKLYWMTEGQWYEVSYAQFARILGFGRKDASYPRIHLALKLEPRKIKFIYPRNKQGNFGETIDMLPFYEYLNQLFRRSVTPREEDGTKILAYNKNILVVMTPNANVFEFSIFYFIWEEIKAISEYPLKSCGYAPYLMHMIERVTAHTFFCEKEHHHLRIKNDSKAPVEDTRAEAPHSSPPRAARERGQQRDKLPSPIQKIFSLLLGICKSQHIADVKAQHERHERKKITKSAKEICAHLNLQPPSSPIASEGEESPNIESFEERIARFEDETPVQCMKMQASVVSILTMVAWPTHPPLTYLLLIPLLRPKFMMMMKKKRKVMKKTTTMSEDSRRPPQHFLVLNDKGEKYQLKFKGLALLCSVLFCLKKSDCPILPSRIFIYLFIFL